MNIREEHIIPDSILVDDNADDQYLSNYHGENMWILGRQSFKLRLLLFNI